MNAKLPVILVAILSVVVVVLATAAGFFILGQQRENGRLHFEIGNLKRDIDNTRENAANKSNVSGRLDTLDALVASTSKRADDGFEKASNGEKLAKTIQTILDPDYQQLQGGWVKKSVDGVRTEFVTFADGRLEVVISNTVDDKPEKKTQLAGIFNGRIEIYKLEKNSSPSAGLPRGGMSCDTVWTETNFN